MKLKYVSTLMATKTTFISFGHRCSIAKILKDLNLKTESYPFDWSISKLPVIEHCIKDNFRQFMDPTNYVKLNTKTVNVIDGNWQEMWEDTALVNKYYEDPRLLVNGMSKYHFQLALTHYDISTDKDREYFERCIDRFTSLLASDRPKVYVYHHAIMGIREFTRKRTSLLIDFANFNDFIQTQTRNAYGIFFLLVKGAPNSPRIELYHQTSEYECHVLYVNPEFADTFAPFGGPTPEDFAREVDLMNGVIKGRALLR